MNDGEEPAHGPVPAGLRRSATSGESYESRGPRLRSLSGRSGRAARALTARTVVLFSRMSKGATTRQTILTHAAGLADDLRLSKSGLFAHFRSKEALQVEVLEHAAARFTDQVVRPALQKRRG